jgi:hypothetical protein
MKQFITCLLVCYCCSTQRTHANDSQRPGVRHIDTPQLGFFSKELDFECIPIKAHQVFADEALVAGYEQLRMMFEHFGSYRESILTNLAKARVELHIIGCNQVTTDLPEWHQDKGKPLPEYNGQTRDQRTRGMGGHLVSCGEENLLKLQQDRYRGRDICVHEFAHCIRNFGISQAVRTRFDEQYKLSLAKGLWVGSYASTNPDEYFSELSMWYFGTHGDLGMTGAKPKVGRKGLQDYNPDAYRLFDKFYNGKIRP